MIQKLIRDKFYCLAFIAGAGIWISLWLLGLSRSEITSPTLLIPFLSFVLIYPVTEEIIFRGYIQGLLLKRDFGLLSYYKLTVANLLTSSAFSLAHFAINNTWFSFLVFIPSLAFGYFRERYNTVIPSIILHVYYNLGFILFIG
ncbi:MAG: JDVT-CTERM system glutamic-type intramembrane protease [Pseudomonadota bacterium]|nr:JDVT-CTERM system glutamic-type intramembrane protease [Pseudomonadota bacterium]